VSSYVRRQRNGRVGWTGPIRSTRQAQREQAAWQQAGWTAEVLPSTPEIRAQVRAWERSKRQRESHA
jgi:hypothetical protein